MTAHMSVSEFLFASRYVIKACRASRMLPWLIRNTGIDEGLVLVRHPCAVVSSMKKHGNWDPLLPTESPYPEIPGQLMNEFKILEKYRIRNENNELTAEEKLGLDWAIDHLVIQNTVFPDTWRIVTYEDLVIRGRDVIEKLFNWLRFPVQEKTVKKAKEKLNMPSRTARESSPPLAENRQLTKYQRHLSEEEIERVLTILDDLNISFYDASPAPNRDELRDLQIASLLL